MTQTVSFPVVHSVLDPAALLRHIGVYYDIGSPVECILLRSWINEVYSVQTSLGRFILKVFRHIEDRQADWNFLVALVQRIQTRLGSLEQIGKLSWGPIHGDATLDNLLITNDEQIGIYDFDQSGPGWRAYELQGVFYWAWQIERPSFWTALTEGYASVQPLSDIDIAAMPCFPILNRLWCMGFEAHVIAQNSGQWIVSTDYFDNRLSELRRWTEVHSELNVKLL